MPKKVMDSFGLPHTKSWSQNSSPLKNLYKTNPEEKTAQKSLSSKRISSTSKHGSDPGLHQSAYSPMAWSPESQPDGTMRERTWSHDTQHTDTSSRLMSQDTEHTEVDSHNSGGEEADMIVFSDMENQIESQLHEVSKYIQKSFQMTSPKHSLHSDDNIAQSPQTDDDLAVLIKSVQLPESTCASLPHNRDLASIHDWEFDWESDVLLSPSSPQNYLQNTPQQQLQKQKCDNYDAISESSSKYSVHVKDSSSPETITGHNGIDEREPLVKTEFDTKLEQLLDRMDVAFQNMITVPSMEIIEDTEMRTLDSKMACRKLSEPNEIDTIETHLSDEKHLPRSPQYTRGSSCETQGDRRTNILVHNGHLCPAVPLASMDDFSDAATSVLSHTSSRLTHPTESEETETDESYSLLRSSNAEASHEDSGCDIDGLAPTLNGPTRNHTDHYGARNVNHKSILQHQLSWIEQGIQSTDDLERIFVQHGSDDIPQVGLTAETEEHHLDFLEFAEKYFNVHYVATSGASGALSKTVNFVKRRPPQDLIAVEDLIRYTRSSNITTSHIRLLNPANVVLAQSIFKDIFKYLHGDVKAEAAYIILRNIVAIGIEHLELRDEIYCQLLRQSNGTPKEEWRCRVWHIMSCCAVCFNPSLTLYNYLVSYLKQEAKSNDDNIASYASYCVQRLTIPDRKARKMPPAFPEIEAVVCLQCISHPVHFLNGRCELLEVMPDCLAKDAVILLAKKIGLQNHQGWALYESTPDYDRHIYEEEYLADIISKWEQKQQERQLAELRPNSPKKSSPKKNSAKMSPAKLPPLKDFGKLVFCKRMFQPFADIPSDPVEIQLLYSQAVHYAVQLDEYNLSTGIAIHLAGLQAHVEFGEYDPSKQYRYSHPNDFICDRILKHSNHSWFDEIAAAHQKYSQNKTTEESMSRYLTLVSQFPLYGCTKIFAHYRGIWPYGAETVLAVNHEGIKFISIQEKTIAFTFYYSELEDIILEERRDEYYIVIQLRNYISPTQQKCFLLECLDLEDFAKCIEYHSPHHALWLQSARSWRHRKFRPPDDWLKLSDQILACRRLLRQKGIISAASQEDTGLLRNALNRLGQRSSTSKKTSYEFEDDPDYADIQNSMWNFTKVPFKTSILHFQSHEMEDVAARMFNSTLVYTGIESAAILEDMDLVVVVQTLIIKCMEKDDLCNELYLQLIKQTTNTHAETNLKAVLRYWHLMTMATCVMFPPNPVIFNYLTLHLKRYAMQGQTTEAGAYALFCIKSLYRTLEGGGRRWPPSFKEIDFVTKRQAIEARVSLPDGHQMLVEFDSSSTCAEVSQLIKAKAGMRLDAEGYGIYLVLGEEENYIDLDEKLADSLHQWEKWAKNTGSRDLKFIFKKRLFVEPYMNLHDPLEVDLLYHQAVTDLFEQKIPLTKSDAVDLCALRAQAEFGDFGFANNFDYKSVMRILPRHLRELINVSEISAVHRKLVGTSPMSANIAFMDVLKHWPLFGATIFEVTNNNNESLPNILWLGITQLGVYLMEKKGQTIYFTYTFKEICEISPGQKNLTLVVGNNHQCPSLLFITNEANEIVQLITDYKQAVHSRRKSSHDHRKSLKMADAKGKRSRKRKESIGNGKLEKGKKFGSITASEKNSAKKSLSHSSKGSHPGSDSFIGAGESQIPLLSMDSIKDQSPCSSSISSNKHSAMCTDL